MSEGMTLEPCPFCGGEASFDTVVRENNDGQDFVMLTVGCCATIESNKCWLRISRGYTPSEDWIQERKKELAESWNTRAHLSQPAQAVDVGAIREVIESLRSTSAMLQSELNDEADKLTCALSGEKAGRVDGWVSVEDRRPERNKPAIYWHKSDFGGFAAIADEWRDEHHLEHATHWMPYTAPASPAPGKDW